MSLLAKIKTRLGMAYKKYHTCDESNEKNSITFHETLILPIAVDTRRRIPPANHRFDKEIDRPILKL